MRVGSHDAEVQCHGERDAAADAKTFNGSNRGLNHFLQARDKRGPSFRWRRRLPISMVRRERPSGSFRSKPALSAFALPVRTTADVSPSSLCGS